MPVCEKCKIPCCDNLTLRRKRGFGMLFFLFKRLRPSKDAKYIYIEGIPLAKKKNGRWRCMWLDKKTNKCKHYRLRPISCRKGYCPKFNKPTFSKQENKMMPNSFYDVVLDLGESPFRKKEEAMP